MNLCYPWSVSLLLTYVCAVSAQSITSFTLVDAESDTVIAEFNPLEEDDEIIVPDLGSQTFSIYANVSGSVGSVAFNLNTGGTVRTENAAPYTLFGDSGGDYTAGSFKEGENVLTATAYSGSNKSGTASPAYTLRFVLTEEGGGVDPDPSIPSAVLETPAAGIYGELKRWHRITLAFTGPASSESASPNPFLDYRLDVRFVHNASGQVWNVPGYYAADGNAGETGSESGNIWRVHFRPSEIGDWTWHATFLSGAGVAVASDTSSAVPATLNGSLEGEESGAFTVTETDKTGRDNRAPERGLLTMDGGRYPRWSGSGKFFLKQGPDAPENLLAYADFDGSFKSDGIDDHRIKSWSPHLGDWQSGDPAWKSGKGRGLIGAINYLAAEEMNAFSFLTMNIIGDDKNVFPYVDYTTFDRIDVSRMDQWEVVFEHADQLGFFLHFKTQETENELLLDGGALGPERKLYYRELIARFGHHLALNWNLGEENHNQTDAQRQDMAAYFHELDPYQHLVVLHTYPNGKSQIYSPLLGDASWLSGLSLQETQSDFSDVHADVVTWVNTSRNAGRPWAVAVDEPGDASHALRPDDDAGTSQIDGRKNALWGTLLGGGWGNEWYFGYQHANSDLTLEDFRSRDEWWDTCRVALDFFDLVPLPLAQMLTDNSLSTATNDYCFYLPGSVYLIYLKNGGSTTLDLSADTGVFDVSWYNPRTGGALLPGSVLEVTGGGNVSVGTPPGGGSDDWLVLVRKQIRVAYIYGDVAEDGTVPSGGAPFDQMRLNDTGSKGLSDFRDLVLDLGFQIAEFHDQGVTLDAAFLNTHEVIIFGLHQKVWSGTEKTALDLWLNAGGGMLIYSDSASGGKWSNVGAQNSVGQGVVNNLISSYGMQVLVDQANGIKAVRPTGTSFHPVVAGRPVLEGEGVSPVAVDPAGTAEVLIPYADDPRVVVSGSPVIPYQQNLSITDPVFAALALQRVGEGHVMVLFDRQPLWNSGPGSDISKRDNQLIFERILRCLAGELPVPDVDADGLHDAWEMKNGFLLNENNADDDSDNDGKTNAEEFRTHTDPQNPLSLLKISKIDLDGGVARISWETALQGGGFLQPPVYQLYHATQLNPQADWQVMGDPVYPVGQMAEAEDHTPSQPSFYRLEVLP